MSDLKSRTSGIEFVPVRKDGGIKPQQWHVVLGVIIPAASIITELTTGLCGAGFFDPIPTPWHVLAVSSVPAANLLLWTHLRHGTTVNLSLAAFANGAALAIAGFYALLFLPLLPLAAIAVLAYGLGLLAFGPLMSFISAIQLRKAYRLHYPETSRRKPLLGGVVLGILSLLAFDVPTATTRLGVQMAASGDVAQRQRGIALLRLMSDEDHLLRLCYDARSASPGLLSWVIPTLYGKIFHPGQRALFISPAEAREVYYRIYGKPFNLKPAPYISGNWARFSDFEFDNDLGGTEVGGRVAGLNLVSSRMDGSISADDAVAYLEWIVEFRNTSGTQREARMELALPPGGVVSRASLWVNGEEREAAYGGRGQVREAYRQVAVVQRRDPLLVTTKGADRVLAQAFPVPPSGTIKFKIGITAPLDLHDPDKARLVLPAIVDRNFSFGEHVNHGLWLESKTPLTASAASLKVTKPDADLYRLKGMVNDKELARARPSVSAMRNPGARARAARIDDGEIIRQQVTTSPSSVPDAMIVVIDGSVQLGDIRSGVIEAIDTIPETARVGIMIAQEPPLSLPVAPWTMEQKKKAVTLIKNARFVGGQDNTPALADALLALENGPNAMLLWVHGPQPVAFSGSASQLEQVSTRLTHLPDVVLYGVEPGPNQALPDTPWAWGARSLPQSGAVAADLADFFVRTFNPQRIVIKRKQIPSSEGVDAGSQHIARLWAKDRVLTLMSEDAEKNRKEATALAARYHLVTPVSGAVVLETRQQFRANGLTPATKAKLPTVPEPHEWALLIIACLMLLWLAWRRRQQITAVH